MTNYREFFQSVLAQEPYPYQEHLANEAWPTLLDVPTGLGKTAAVVVAWLYKTWQQDSNNPTRLVYVLPMRVLVEQIHDNVTTWLQKLREMFASAGREIPSVHKLMGGHIDEFWEGHPETPAILIGTQDQLLSRALNRGYAMSRYRWPMHFGLLNNDALWVFDETQLMGVGVETSAQLQALRQKLGCLGKTQTLWMSATLHPQQLQTFDHLEYQNDWTTLTLSDQEKGYEPIRRRLQAAKSLQKLTDITLHKDNKDTYAANLAQHIVQEHQPDSLTLVIVNQVERAKDVYQALLKTGRSVDNTALIHSRFRRQDRSRQEKILYGQGDRIVVSTQVIEAGVDVSAQTMFTEIAPFSSLIQRWGRCNRSGEYVSSRIFWIDIDPDKDDTLILPYAVDEVNQAKAILSTIEGDVNPSAVSKIAYTPTLQIRPVLRRRELLELFDTTPDLTGQDIDISRYIRDDRDTDVQCYWRELGEEKPSAHLSVPRHDELCAVPIGQAKNFVSALRKQKLSAWHWNALEKDWREVSEPRPGQILLLSTQVGGYHPDLGWIGKIAKHPTEHVPVIQCTTTAPSHEGMDDEPETYISRPITLLQHLADVTEETRKLLQPLCLPEDWKQSLLKAAQWHDVGKAHEVFQQAITPDTTAQTQSGSPGQPEASRANDLVLSQPIPLTQPVLWAKSNKKQGRARRKYFRHELASALAWMQHTPDTFAHKDLVAYLIVSHHGKVRMSIRALPQEKPPKGPDRLFARGVWDGDPLPVIQLPDGSGVGPFQLDLSIMQMGTGSWLERMLRLRDDTTLGPFRLGYLETLLRVGDWRASAQENKVDYIPVPILTHKSSETSS